MFQHGFSDETPIEEILRSHLGIELKQEPLKEVLVKMASRFDSQRQNLQPTYAQFSLQSMKVKFEYLIGRVIRLYELDDLDAANQKKFFWQLVSELKETRMSKSEGSKSKTKGLKNDLTTITKSETNNLREASAVDTKLEVTLYDYQDASLNINSYAYFENDDLVIDYWRLDYRTEDEYFVTVKKENLGILYSVLEIEEDRKQLLLAKLSSTFSDVNCLDNLKSFLSLNNIAFDFSVHHDEC